MANHTSLLIAFSVAALVAGCKQDRPDEVARSGEDMREEPTANPTVGPAAPAAPTPSMGAAPTTDVTPKTGEETHAEADLEAAEGQEIEGEVKFHDSGNGVRVVAEIEDLKPGSYGFHVHEKGDCSDIKGKSMGEHFNPEPHAHALPGEAEQRHLGDLGNVTVNEKGEGRLEINVPKANLKPDDRMSFLGKAVVVHTGRDQGQAHQPSGDSGAPIACGVIKES